MAADRLNQLCLYLFIEITSSRYPARYFNEHQIGAALAAAPRYRIL